MKIAFRRTQTFKEHEPDLRHALVALDEVLQAVDIDLEENIEDPDERLKRIKLWLNENVKYVLKWEG
jgi:hypothetical protein